jgi:hypothetical protein
MLQYIDGCTTAKATAAAEGEADAFERVIVHVDLLDQLVSVRGNGTLFWIRGEPCCNLYFGRERTRRRNKLYWLEYSYES